MPQVPRRVVIQEVVRDVELGGDLLKIRSRDPQRARQHVIIGIEQVIPLPRGQRRDASGEHIADRRIADLRAQTDEHRVAECVGIARKGVVADERAEAVRAHHVVTILAQLREDDFARARPQVVFGRPLRNHARGPLQRFRNAAEPAGVVQHVADFMNGAARQQLGECDGVSRGVKRGVIEHIVVLDEIDLRLQGRIPGLDGGHDRTGPAGGELGIGLLMADAVHAENGQRFAQLCLPSSPTSCFMRDNMWCTNSRIRKACQAARRMSSPLLGACCCGLERA